MGRIESLRKSYAEFISLPWAEVAPAQRVIFCVYGPEDERRLRARLEGFRAATIDAGRGWAEHDLTDSFAEWLSGQRYALKYFESPELLEDLLPRYLDSIVDGFGRFMEEKGPDANSVVAVTGAGSLFGFVKVNDMVVRLAPLVKGRLLVFFPGSCGSDSYRYRLLDANDGWNYHAVPITAGRGE
ncbi:MAG: DUF1788 domain-containing protein [Deltaproteobacteria bacterium]|nr:DUF1788 domain-containing protein [Deltaproteobacteria bacterium]